MYDGPHQIEKFKEMAKKANVPDEMMILRDRWYNADSEFGLKLTNRAGTIKIGNQKSPKTYSTCFYPTYQFLIDWNGDIFLCPQDWQRRVTMGNMIQDSLFNIWKGKIMTKFRKNLLNGKRCDSPCSACNAEGTLLGSKLFETDLLNSHLVSHIQFRTVVKHQNGFLKHENKLN